MDPRLQEEAASLYGGHGCAGDISLKPGVLQGTEVFPWRRGPAEPRVISMEAGVLQGTEMSRLRMGTCRRSVVLSSVLEIRSEQAAAFYAPCDFIGMNSVY